MYRGYGMKTQGAAVVLITVLVIGTLGGIFFIGETEIEPPTGITAIYEYDGDDPPSDPDGIPSGDPEHPQ